MLLEASQVAPAVQVSELEPKPVAQHRPERRRATVVVSPGPGRAPGARVRRVARIVPAQRSDAGATALRWHGAFAAPLGTLDIRSPTGSAGRAGTPETLASPLGRLQA